MKTLFVLLISLTFCPITLSSQIVNIEAKRVTPVDSSEWRGQINLGLNLIENGNSIINLNGGINIEYIKNRHWFLSLSNFNFVQVEQQDFVNDGFQHFRYNYQINSQDLGLQY